MHRKTFHQLPQKRLTARNTSQELLSLAERRYESLREILTAVTYWRDNHSIQNNY